MVPSSRHVDFLILGAGPTGLAAARQLEKLGLENWVLAEQSSFPGGLASSLTDEHGFTWDIGGHVQFSHYEYFDQAMDDFLGADGWLTHQREAWIWMRDRFIPYPIQKNLHHLPEQDLLRCLEGLVEITRRPPTSVSNFAEWIEANFGPGIADVFLTPYNQKVWAHSPETMNAHWVGERVAATDLMQVLRSVIRRQDDVSWGPNNTFRFPKHGGTGSIWRSAASQLPQQNLLYGQQAVALNLEAKNVQFENGLSIGYEYLIATIPLLELVKISGQTQLRELANDGLPFSQSHIFGIGLAGEPPEHLKTKCWMYFPESDCPFYRVTVFSNYSPNNVPRPGQQWSLMAEVSASRHKEVDTSRLMEQVVQGLIKTRLISADCEILSQWQYCARYGYPVPGLRRDEVLGQVIPYFEDYSVYSRGRFGFWKYEVSNQDHSFMQGVELVERLVNSRNEITAFNPSYANSGYHKWPYPEWCD